MKKINLVGEIYGDLQVISFSHRTENNGMSHYFCQCLCGKQKIVSHGNLRTGHTTSCGCKRERSGSESANFAPENKKFSVRKLGLMPAFKAAVEYRRKMIEELNAQGAGYTENHGK